MPKRTKTSSIINTINEIINTARSRQIVHLYTDDDSYNGRDITIGGKSLINFGSCSYLALEVDQRLKDSAIDAVQKYGSQLACSRTYVSCTPYEELEDLIGKMFNAPFLISTVTTLGHQAVIPVVVEDNDAVILDQQAHFSMRDAAEKLQLRGIPVTMLRHSNIEELQEKINELGPKHHKLWYFIDGVYSMYGDLAPIDQIKALMEKNRQLHLYVDDAHGISWGGKNGTGHFLSEMGLHPKMIFCTSLGKGFASAGGVFVFPNKELCQRVKNWGGPLTHSGPQPPAVIGASIASARVHLSQEIYERQRLLREKIDYCNKLLKDYDLPLVTESISPVFFIGLGLTKVGYNIVRRLVDSGFYVNLGIFPAVPETCTGIRFTLTLHHSFEDIKNLVEAIAFHLPLALIEENRTMKDIYRAFRTMPGFKEKYEETFASTSELGADNYLLEHRTSIKSIPKSLWNSLLGNNGAFDWDALVLFEDTFNRNEKIENNWNFHYYLVYDRSGKVMAATYFTHVLLKDDMLAPASISEEVEAVRKEDPYYLSSKSLMMGCLLTEGEHLYLDRKNAHWKEVLTVLLEAVWKTHENIGTEVIYFRDFSDGDIEIRDFLVDHGFVKVEMPETHILEDLNWNDREEFLQNLSGSKRYKIRKDVLPYEKFFEISHPENPTEEEINYWYKLYENVKGKNLAINVFDLPRTLFSNIANHPNIDIIELRLLPEYDNRQDRQPVAVGFIYKTIENYCPMVLGLDYNYVKEFNIYRQLLFQAVMRARALGKKKIFLGLTAREEKEKFGAKAVPQVAFLQAKDGFNRSLLSLIPNRAKAVK